MDDILRQRMVVQHSSKERNYPYSFLLICIFFLIYWIPAEIQTPLRVLLLLCFNFIVFMNCRQKFIYLGLLLITSFFILYKIEKGSFDTSLLMVALSVGPVFFFDVLGDKMHKINKRFLRVACIISIIGVAIQLVFYSYHGRPNMSYEINHSASYIFLLFMWCDYLGFKYIRVVVLCLAVLLLSRLCLLAIIGIYIVRFLKKILFKESFRFSYLLFILFLGVSSSIFSFWYSLNMKDDITSTSDDSSRLKSINDGSNYYRFMLNMRVLLGIYEGDEKLIKEGYGDLAQNSYYNINYGNQPHNELIKHIAQYGVIFCGFLLFVSSRYYKNLTNYRNLEYLIPIFIYTQILWVRFTIIPSIEMLFIFHLLTLNNHLKLKK